MWALNFENTSSIGLQSGGYGGRNKSQAPHLSTGRPHIGAVLSTDVCDFLKPILRERNQSSIVDRGATTSWNS